MTETHTARWEQLNQAGCRYLGSGDFAHADESFKAALVEADQLGPESLHLATTLNNFGQLKYRQREFEQAGDLFRRSLAIRERVLGADHAVVLQSINNLSALYVANGDLTQAEPLLERALTLSQNRLEGAQSDVAVNLNNLARLHFRRNDYQKAEPLLLRLLALKRSLGRDHPEVAAVLASLAKLRHTLGNFEGAERLWRRVLVIREQTAEPNDAAIATALENLAESTSARGRDDESISLRERALRLREQSMGADHASLAPARAKIAELRAKRAPAAAPAKQEVLLKSRNWPTGDFDRIAPPPTAGRSDSYRTAEEEMTDDYASHPAAELPAISVQSAAEAASVTDPTHAHDSTSLKMPLPKIGEPSTDPKEAAAPKDRTVWWSPDASPEAMARQANKVTNPAAGLIPPPLPAMPSSAFEAVGADLPDRAAHTHRSHELETSLAQVYADMEDDAPRRRAPNIAFRSAPESWGKKAGIASGVLAAAALIVWLLSARGGEPVTETAVPTVTREEAAPVPKTTPLDVQQRIDSPTDISEAAPPPVSPTATPPRLPPIIASPSRESEAHRETELRRSSLRGSSALAPVVPAATDDLVPKSVGNLGLDRVTRAIDDSSRARSEAAVKVEAKVPTFPSPR